ncbi:hypothetical protein [Thermoflexibacter ruber]|uniref:Outer membrane protein beta-barrel domain-containing protein n=1 Tax=Thermoflexibacter ruber TaxID=1003 RepID=A0A1I2DQ63_9BACT|nr:hypothetical protein [Thermoflexibacter ruber]SFE82433.1 hypothetical protein SAMN04488541_1007114 [Thermoflexibacter ruber]
MKNLLVLCLFFLFFHSLFAQDKDTTKRFKYNNYYDLAISVGKGIAIAPSWSHFHKIGKRGKFQVGYGIRLTSFFGSKVEHITAPAKFTTANTGLGVIFQETIEANLDTLTLEKIQVNAINININLQYAFSKQWEIGFNIDALGVSFGGTQKGTFVALSQGRNPSQETAKPTTLNLLLTSDNDIGSLNSELYLRYWFHTQWAVRGGLTFAFSEYTSSGKLVFDNDRFRAKILMLMLGITFSPYR